MPEQALSLNGAWQIVGHDPSSSQSIDISGTVPGHVHTDLLKAGRIPDPFWRDQADMCQWVEDWNWQYTREFDLDETFDRRWAVLEFAGLDTYAEVTLNGEVVGRTANMFVPHRFEVGDKLRVGKNVLQVIFFPYKDMIKGKSLEPYPAAFMNSERVHVRRMQCTFHWDWVNRFVSAGIWRPVTLYAYAGASVKDLFIYTSSLHESSALLNVEFTVEMWIGQGLLATVEILDPDGKLVCAKRIDTVAGLNHLTCNVTAAKLWWPNGMGDQPLYTCRVTLSELDETPITSRQASFGIRTIHIEQVEDAPGSDEWAKTMEIRARCPEGDRSGEEPGRSFTVVVNGQRVFCKGGNWVPADPFPSRIPQQHYDRLIKLARDANMNLLRCWGGGIYEPETFWDACNRYGIMVSQDFQMACALYPRDDAEFRANIQEEIQQIVRMLRNHPSLIWWTGDNECGMGDDYDADYWGRNIATSISGPLCADLDPSRPFFPTSPYGGRPNNALTIGDCHHSALWQYFRQSDMTDYAERISIIGRFISEYAIMGAPPLRSLLKFMTIDDVAATDKAMWEYHTKHNPHLGDDVTLTLHGLLATMAEKLFGHTDELTMRVRHMEYVEYEWIRLAMEAVRRNKWYCSGIQFWMYNDCWPASGWSMVDYYGFPKAGYYAMRRAAKSLIVSLEDAGDSYRIWVCNDRLQPASGEVILRIQPWSGNATDVLHAKFTIPANVSQVVATIQKTGIIGIQQDQAMLICDLHSDAGTDRAFSYDRMPHQMHLPEAHLRVKHQRADDHGTITISADQYARVVTIDADLDFSDNYFDLLPGETRTVEWSSPTGNFDGEIPVTCWNMASDETDTTIHHDYATSLPQ